MVERPIKKSERQTKANTDNSSGNSDSAPPPIESNSKSSSSSYDRSSGKRKKESSKNEPKEQINPALARGPKPVKAPVIVPPEPETEPEQTSPDSQDEQSPIS